MSARKFCFAAVLAVVGVLAAPPTAKAAFLLQLTSGNETLTLDLGTLTSGSGGSGTSETGEAYSYVFFYLKTEEGTTTAVFTDLKFAGYTIDADTNITNSPGSDKGGNLSLNGLTVTRDNGGTSEDDLTIALTATGYDKPDLQDTLESNFGARLNTLADTVPLIDFRSSFASGDNEFGDDISNTTSTFGSDFDALKPFSEGQSSSLGANTTTYTLTNVLTISGLGFGKDNRLDNGGVSTLVTPSLVVQAVPAPTGLILALGAVPFLGLLRRRLRATGQPEAPATAA
jgi:hypothetical protein